MLIVTSLLISPIQIIRNSKMGLRDEIMLIIFSVVLHFSEGLSASHDSQKLQPRIFNQEFDLVGLSAREGREGRRMNVPPMLRLPNPPLWNIPVSTNVGSRISTLQTAGPTPPGVRYIFSLDPVDFSADYFSLDNRTGEVRLKKTLDIQKHQSFIVIPGVTDGELTARSEIKVIVSKDGDTGVADQAPNVWPGLSPPSGGFFPPNFRPSPVPPRTPSTSADSFFTFATSEQPTQSSVTAADEPSSTVSATGTPEPVAPPSDSKSYLAFLAIPALILLLVPFAICFCKRRNYQRALQREKIKIEKSLSADTAKSTCKGSIIDYSAEYPGPPPKKFLQAAPSNNRYLNRRKSASTSSFLTGSDGYLQPDMTDELWEVPRETIDPLSLRLIGEGCSGQVFRAEALEPSGAISIVAIKTLKANAAEREKRDLLNELQVMKSLAKDAHPNVVSLLGCCTLEDPIYVIMEFLEHGKLQSYLRNSRDSHYYGNIDAENKETLTSKQLTQFGYQAANGMDYLSKRGILHRDLAARNILLDENKICKVSDFGLARDVIDSHIYERKSECRLPVRWMAPESLHDNIFTSKSDVWSFGILLWEICTLGSTPYVGTSAHEVAKRILNSEFRLAKPAHCERELYNIMYYCWAARDVDRPTFSELKKMLEQLLTVDVDYLHMDNFPENDYYNTVTPVSDEKV